MRWRHLILGGVIVVALCALLPEIALAQDTGDLTLNTGSDDASGLSVEFHTGEDGNFVPALKVALLLLALTLLPAILISVTSFTRIIVVLGFVRHALGTQSLPPSQVLLGLALFLCLFTMSPVLKEIHEVAIIPHQSGQLTDEQAFEVGVEPLRRFMARHTRPEDLKLILSMLQDEKPQSFSDVSTIALIPAFMLSELRTAFIMGALIFIPFVIIDLVVASLLMGMGMMMVPPVMVSLPLKILLFVVADGWNLIVGSLVRSVMS